MSESECLAATTVATVTVSIGGVVTLFTVAAVYRLANRLIAAINNFFSEHHCPGCRCAEPDTDRPYEVTCGACATKCVECGESTTPAEFAAGAGDGPHADGDASEGRQCPPSAA